MPRGHVGRCPRCGFAVRHARPRSRGRTLALTTAAAILFVPANVYPVLSTAYWGSETRATIWDGIQRLLSAGSWGIAALVFTTSLLAPSLKIVGLTALSVWDRPRRGGRLRAWTLRTVRFLGPWNMLEVYLLAIGVTIAELGEIARVEPGPGVVSFAAVVVLTIAASHTFDAEQVWHRREEVRA